AEPRSHFSPDGRRESAPRRPCKRAFVRLRGADPARRRHLRGCRPRHPAHGGRLRSGPAQEHRGALFPTRVSRRHDPHRDVERERDLVPLPRPRAWRNRPLQRPGAPAMTSSTAFVTMTTERGIATVSFTRPEKSNAYNRAMLRSLADGLTTAAQDSSIR